MSRPLRRVGESVRFAVGIGARPGVRAEAVRTLIERVVDDHGLDLTGAVFATIASRADEPGLRDALGGRAERDVKTVHDRVADDRPADGSDPSGSARGGSAPDGVIAWQAHELGEEIVPTPSGRVAEAVGTPSVAEAAALRTARTFPDAIGAELVVPKTVGDGVTVAVARPLLDEST